MNDTGCKCFHYPSCSTLRIHLHFAIASLLITVCCTNYVQIVPQLPIYVRKFPEIWAEMQTIHEV